MENYKDKIKQLLDTIDDEDTLLYIYTIASDLVSETGSGCRHDNTS